MGLGLLRGSSPAAPALGLLLLASRAGAAAAAGGGKWYVDEYEYSFVEVLLLICLVSLAIVFEEIAHQMQHRVASSYRYGDLQEIVDTAMGSQHGGRHGKSRHVQLQRELMFRLCSEFMTLGFLALCIFLFREFHGFELLQNASSPSAHFRCPETEEDWLHMAEIVHMKLFFGMIFYFVLISRVVTGSVEKIRLWERMMLHHVGRPDYDAQTMRPAHAMEADLAEFIGWRGYFIAKIVKMQSRVPAMFNDIFAKLGIDSAAPNATKRLQAVLASQFSFAAYLALNIEEGVKDSIQVHLSTWTAVLVLFGLFALLHRFAHISLLAVVPVCIAIVIAILVAMQCAVSCRRARITRQMKALAKAAGELDGAGSSDSARRHMNERFKTERISMRMLQVVLFLISYGFARTLLDFHDWEDYPKTTLLYSSCFAVLFMALAYQLPTVVPIFLGIMAMPPCLDDNNFAIFQDVLLLGRTSWLEQQGCKKSKVLGDPEAGEQSKKADERSGAVLELPAPAEKLHTVLELPSPAERLQAAAWAAAPAPQETADTGWQRAPRDGAAHSSGPVAPDVEEVKVDQADGCGASPWVPASRSDAECCVFGSRPKPGGACLSL